MCRPIKGGIAPGWCSTSGSAYSCRPGRRPSIVGRLNAEINKALEAVIREGLLQQAQEPVGGTAEEAARLFRDDYAKYGRLVKELNIQPY